MKPTMKANTQFSPYQLTGTAPRCGRGFKLILITEISLRDYWLCVLRGLVQLLTCAPNAPTQSNDSPLNVFLSEDVTCPVPPQLEMEKAFVR